MKEYGCFTCKNSSADIELFNKTGEIKSKCHLGHKDKFDEWWKNNGHKKSGDIVDKMNCFNKDN